jgi:hypothetical protein
VSSDASRTSTTDCLASPRCRLSQRGAVPFLSSNPIRSVPFHDSFLTSLLFPLRHCLLLLRAQARQWQSPFVRVLCPSMQVMCWVKRQRCECSGFWLCHFRAHARHLHHPNPSFYYSIAGKLKHNIKYKSPFCAMFSAKCDNSFPSQFLNSQVLSFPAFSSHIVD